MPVIELTEGEESKAEELANVELGIRLGLYEALAAGGPANAAELAGRAGIANRYAREWLEQQAVAGVLTVDDATRAPEDRRFELPNAHAHVLLDDDSEACMKPCAAVVTWVAKAVVIMVEEFRDGTGAAFGLFDLDRASVELAQRAATDAGVSDRVRFEARDAADSTIEGDYDLVMAIEMLHDVPDPVGILRTMGSLAGDDGAVLVVDERTKDVFTVPTNEVERLFYSCSTLHCLAVSMQEDGAGTGTVIRAETLVRYATEAGFTTVEALELEHPQFVLYRLR